MIGFMYPWILIFIICAMFSTVSLRLIKIKSLGLSLAIGYTIAVVLAVITVCKSQVDEPDWYFVGVYILGLPMNFFASNLLNDFFKSLFISMGLVYVGPLAEGVSYSLGGGIQYYLVGFLVQNFVTKSKLFIPLKQ